MIRLLAGFLMLTALWGAGKDTVVFDTDSGLFGDDGAALTMLVRSPSLINLQGITIVPGNVWAPQGAEYMFHILDLLKRTQPAVATGADGPLIHTTAMAKESERRWGTLSYIGAFAQELQVLDRGQLVLASSLRDVAIPVQVSSYGVDGGHHGGRT